MKTVAFFDVDETIITIKSMIDFLTWSYPWLSISDSMFHQFLDEILSLVRAGEKELANKRYFTIFEGQKVCKIYNLADQWYDSLDKEILYREIILKKIESHKIKNHDIVLVSGAPEFCIQPIANELDIKNMICTVVETKEGLLTGKLLQQSLGREKERLMKKYMQGYKVEKLKTIAYADDISDISMLKMVDHPVAVVNKKTNFMILH